MTPARRYSAARQYHDSSVAIVAEASPHRQVAMLFEGALDRLNFAIAALVRQDVQAKLRGVGATIEIVKYLRAVLDTKAGGAVAMRLAALYDYMLKRLMQANLKNDVNGMKEVARLLGTVKSGWDGIQPQVR